MSGLSLTIHGAPHGQPRPRFFRKGRGPVRVVSTASRAVELWRTAIERAAREAVENLGGRDAVAGMMGASVAVSARFIFPHKSRDKWGSPHGGKPDADNLAKLLLDCLANVGALGGDDARAASLEASKVWGVRGGVAVTVRPLHGPENRPAVDQGGEAPGWLSAGVG